ncbi:hypothetical protein ACWFR1_33065 [Streptomyces sp. NPDC055103]
MRPRPWTWVWVSAVVTLFCGGPLALLVWGAMAWDDIGRPEPVDCAEAMTFARGALPADATEARCTAAHWQDTTVEAEFRMPRDRVKAWVAGTYPTGEPSYACEQDLCVDVSYGDALYVHLRVAYEDGVTALVRVEAFDI